LDHGVGDTKVSVAGRELASAGWKRYLSIIDAPPGFPYSLVALR
jgi:hypothetical protein